MKRLLNLIVFACMAAGCGESTGPDPTRSATQTGYLVTAVSGVAYETATQLGVTDDLGAFTYEEGETVTFRLGDTVLGETIGQERVTPFDLAGTEVTTDGWRDLSRAGRRFNRVVNLLVFLRTFDDDGDAANGVQILEDIAALFDGVEVPLDKAWSLFRTDRVFRNALNYANTAGLLQSYAAPADPVAALTHLYQELGVTPGFFAADSQEIDRDGDGVSDELVSRQHDARGFAVRERRQEVGLGEIVIETEIGAWAQTTLRTEDLFGDGITDTIYRYEFNVDGHPTRNETDYGADGVIDSRFERAYNEFGEITLLRRDDDADGTPELVIRWTYTEGRIDEASDADGDGVVDRIVVVFLDEAGQRTRVEYDDPADGTLDRIETISYDDAGNRVRTEQDSDADGITDSIRTREYDADGREIRSTEDADADGVADWVSTTTYNADGNRLRTEGDSGADGTIDSVTTWTYDERGNMTRRRSDDDGDGSVDYELINQYDENGFVVAWAQDSDGDGLPDYAQTATGVPVGWGYYFWD